MVTGVLALGHETVCFVSLGLGALVLLLCIFFGRTCCHPGERVWVWLLRSPLRGSLGSSPPSTCCVGGVVGPGLPGPARLDISLLPTWCLVLGPGFLVRRLPSVAFPWVGPVGGSFMSPHFWIVVFLISWKYGTSFLGDLSFLLSVTFDSFSSSSS